MAAAKHHIDRIRRQIEEAENAFDAQGMVSLLADDAVLMVPDYPVQEGKAAVAAFTAGLFEYFRAHLKRRIVYRSDEVAVLSDIAFDRGTFFFDVKEIGDASYERVTGKYLWLMRQRGGNWLLTRIIISRDEPDEPPAD